MPLLNGELITPEEAMAQDLCPECARDLTQINPIAHRNSHWHKRPNDDVDGQEGLKRLKLFDDYIADHDFRTSDQPERKPNAAPRK